MPETRKDNTMSGVPEWLARYNDGTYLGKSKENDEGENSFQDIDQSKLDIFEVWMRKEQRIPVGEPGPDGQPKEWKNKVFRYPVFAMKFHPEIMRLICFSRTITEMTMQDKQVRRVQKMFFGYQITVGGIRKKNFQVVWSLRGDNGLMLVEKGTGRSPDLPLNPGDKK